MAAVAVTAKGLMRRNLERHPGSQGPSSRQEAKK
jgi:hypothetical protein